MKILKLSSENVKRLTAVEITPDGTLVTVAGKNGAGKSSVLDSIAYALGGEKLVPSEPIRTGESDAKIIVDLGDLIVTRRFSREKLIEVIGETADKTPITKEAGWGETKSTLTVTNREGAKYPSPQAVLDKLLGRLTFDPLAFSREKPERQNEILRQLTSLDFTMLNTRRKEAYDRRSMHNKSVKLAEGKLAAMTRHVGAPAVEIAVDAISAEIRKGQELSNLAIEAEKAVNEQAKTLGSLAGTRALLEAAIARLKDELKAKQDELDGVIGDIEIGTKDAEGLVAAFDAAKKAVPDFEALDSRLREIDDTNRKVRENRTYADAEAEVKRLSGLAEAESKVIEDIDTSKDSMLGAAKFPVEGLGLTDDGVTFEGLPLDQVSSSVQLRVSIAIGLALNPTLKVLLIRNGNLLDEDSLKLVAAQAEEAGAQVWMEFVTANAEGMTVMMEDGHARG